MQERPYTSSQSHVMKRKIERNWLKKTGSATPYARSIRSTICRKEMSERPDTRREISSDGGMRTNRNPHRAPLAGGTRGGVLYLCSVAPLGEGTLPARTSTRLPPDRRCTRAVSAAFKVERRLASTRSFLWW